MGTSQRWPLALVVPISQRSYRTILHPRTSRKVEEAVNPAPRVHFAAVEKVDHRGLIQKYDLAG